MFEFCANGNISNKIAYLFYWILRLVEKISNGSQSHRCIVLAVLLRQSIT